MSFKLATHKLFPGAVLPIFSPDDLQQIEVDDVRMLVIYASNHGLPLGEEEISALYYLYDKEYGKVFGHLLDIEERVYES